MSYYQVQAGTVYDSFDSLTGWTNGGTSGGSENTELSTSIFTEGTGSIKLTCAGGASSNRTITKTISQSFSAYGVMSIDVYNPDTTKTNTCTVYLSEDSGFTKFFSIVLSQGVMRNGWNRYLLSRSDWSNTGSASWENTMIRMRFRVDSATDQIGVAHFDNFIVGRYNRPKFVFRFDDNRTSQYTVAYPYMADRGFKGSIFTISDAVGTAGYMTLTQMSELHDRGWDMSNHTQTHTDLSTLTLNQQTTEISNCSTYLSTQGWTRRAEHLHTVYPFGGYDSNTLTVLGSLSHLTGGTIISPKTVPYPLDIPYQLTIDNIAQTVTLASATSRVDRVIRQGGCGVFLFHIITGTAVASTEWPTADFQALCDYLYQRQAQIDVVTWTEFYQGLIANRRPV